MPILQPGKLLSPKSGKAGSGGGSSPSLLLLENGDKFLLEDGTSRLIVE